MFTRSHDGATCMVNCACSDNFDTPCCAVLCHAVLCQVLWLHYLERFRNLQYLEAQLDSYQRCGRGVNTNNMMGAVAPADMHHFMACMHACLPWSHHHRQRRSWRAYVMLHNTSLGAPHCMRRMMRVCLCCVSAQLRC
jgi:hypothetical protein